MIYYVKVSLKIYLKTENVDVDFLWSKYSIFKGKGEPV